MQNFMKKNLQKTIDKKISKNFVKKYNPTIKLIGFIIVFCIGFNVQNAFGQSIFYNPITGTTPNTSNPYTTGQVVNANITVSGIGRGSGITSNNANDRYNAQSWPNGGRDANDYFEFTLTPNAGYKIRLKNLIYTGASSNDGPNAGEIRTSLDSYTAALATTVTRNATVTNTIDLSAAIYQNITAAITFRIYAYGANTSAGTYSINDFSFNGSVRLNPEITPVITSSLATLNGDVNSPMSVYTITANNFPDTFNATGLPPGLNINTQTGEITGIPTTSGNYNVTITATNTAGTDTEILPIFISPISCTTYRNSILWNFTTNTNLTSTYPSPIVNFPNANISAITRGNGINNSSTMLNNTLPSGPVNPSAPLPYTTVSAGNNLQTNCRIAAFNSTTSTYFEFTLTPNTGVNTTLTGIDFGTRSTDTGPQSYTIRSSADTYTSNIVTGTIANDFSWNLKTHSIIAAAVANPITYRIYGYDGIGAQPGGTATNWRIDDLKLNFNTTNPPYTWTGTTSTAWETPTNWACGLIPDANTTQINIPGAPANQPVLNTNVLVSGILNLQDAGSTLSVNGQTLTLNSTVIGNGSLIGSATSNLVVENTGGPATSLRMSQTGNNNQLNNYSQNREATVTLSNALKINGIVNLSGTNSVLASGSGAGNLTLLSTASTTSGIGYLDATANVTGNVNVQSFFTGGSINTRGTRMIAFPVQDNQVSPKFIFEQIKSQQFFTGPGNTSQNFDLGGTRALNAITMVTQNETKLDSQYGFNLTPTLLTRTIPATAYFLFYRGDRTTNIGPKLNEPFAIPENVTQNYNGPINKGTINIGVTHTVNTPDLYDGICAIGNPYPAVIDFVAFLSDNASRLEDILSIIKPDRSGQITRASGVSTNNNFNATIGGAAQDIRYIQPCQSFYVRVLPGKGGNVTFNETQKATNMLTPARLLGKPDANITSGLTASQKQTANQQSPQKVLRLALNNTILNNETAIIFKAGNQANYQNNDAILLTTPILNCATLSSDGVTLAINLMPQISSPTSIKILVNSETTENNLKLNFSNLIDFTDYSLILKDNYLNTLTPINPANATYNFGIDKSINNSFGKNRLELLIEPKATLPLNFISFTAQANNHTAKLKWQVATNNAVAYFEIQKATDGVNFTTIGQTKVNTQNNVFYTYVDANLLENSYYQIKQVNKDGTFETSPIQFLNTQINNTEFTIYPNPVLNLLNLVCATKTQTPLQINVYSVDGKKIKSFISEPKNPLQLNVADLLNGVYLLKVSNQSLNQVLFKGKFIKQ